MIMYSSSMPRVKGGRVINASLQSRRANVLSDGRDERAKVFMAHFRAVLPALIFGLEQSTLVACLAQRKLALLDCGPRRQRREQVITGHYRGFLRRHKRVQDKLRVVLQQFHG